MVSAKKQSVHLVTASELAPRLGVTVRHLRRLAQANRCPHYRVGGAVRFDPDEVMQHFKGDTSERQEARKEVARPVPVPVSRHGRASRVLKVRGGWGD